MGKNGSDEKSDLPHFSESDIEIADFFYKPTEKVVKEQTAKRIANCLVIGFLLLLSFPFFYLFLIVIISNADQTILEIAIKHVIDLLTTVSAVLGGIVGAVVTYYFTVVHTKES